MTSGVRVVSERRLEIVADWRSQVARSVVDSTVFWSFLAVPLTLLGTVVLVDAQTAQK
jgi:hypothetical protein